MRAAPSLERLDRKIRVPDETPIAQPEDRSGKPSSKGGAGRIAKAQPQSASLALVMELAGGHE